MRIGLVLTTGVFDSGVSALLDLFSTANALRGRTEVQVTRLGFGREVTTGQGARHATLSWRRARGRFDRVVLTGFATPSIEDLEQRLASPEHRSLVEWARTQAARGARIDAGCSGTWIAARAGLLDGREATTSWWFADAFARAFPKVKLDAKRALVHSGPITTAGAAFAHVDLGLAILRAVSPVLANQVADHLVTETRSSQALYLVEHHAKVDDPVVRAFERAVAASLEAPFSLDKVARQLGTSTRTLQRRVTEAAGRSPVKLVQQLRLRRALGLLRGGRANVDAVAAQVGYQSGHTLRQLLKRELGTGVRDLRRGG